VSTGHYIYSTF